MSQTSFYSFNNAADALLPIKEHWQHSQGQNSEVFEQTTGEYPVFSSSHSQALDVPNFTCNDTHVDLTSPYSPSVSGLSSYSSNHQIIDYSYLSPHEPHPYQVEQDAHQPHESPTVRHRPAPIRGYTNTSLLLPAQPLHGAVRRRSLSHGDLDRIATTPANPTFVRLQAPHPQPSTMAKKKKSKSYSRQGRSASHGPGTKGRPLKNPVTYIFQGSPLGEDMLPTPVGTPIGTPLDASREEPKAHSWKFGRDDTNTTQGYMAEPSTGQSRHSSADPDPLLFRMKSPVDLEKSRKIIQLGMMATRKETAFDPELINDYERNMKKLDEIEHFITQGGEDNDDALHGCAMIREVLQKKQESAGLPTNSEIDNEDVPSMLLTEEVGGVFGDYFGGADIMGVMKRE